MSDVNTPMQGKVYQVFTTNDFDGAVALLTFMWSKPNDTITYQELAYYDKGIFTEYVKRTLNPPSIIALDICLDDDIVREADHPNITFINSLEKNEQFADKFVRAKFLSKRHTSTSLLLRELLKPKAPELSMAQKRLIAYADDYESRRFELPESYDLNILFWTSFRRDFVRFVQHYRNGFVPFTSDQRTRIQEAKNFAKTILADTNIFTGKLVIDGQVKNVVAAMAPKYNSITIDLLLKKYPCDILFYINLSTEGVSLRQNPTDSPVNLIKFAKDFCDGDGHNYAAGGNITPLFLELTKNLNPL